MTTTTTMAPAAVVAAARPRLVARTRVFSSTRRATVSPAAARLDASSSSSPSSGMTILTYRSHHGRLDAAVEHPRTRRTASIVTRAADDPTAGAAGASKDDDDSDDGRRAGVVDDYDDDDWVKKNEDIVRAYPLVVGVTAVVAILVNRAVSGIAAVADASSSQTRADVLALIMAGTLILTGLTWISLKPKDPFSVRLNGAPLGSPYVDASLTEYQRRELAWMWEAIQAGSSAGAAAVYYDGRRVMQAGVVPKKLAFSLGDAGSAMKVGKICEECMRDGRSNYLANLALFPGRVEFVGPGEGSYMPDNTQAVVVVPVGDKGVMVCGSGTQRGFTRADQSWFSCLAEKLDVTLSGEMERSGLRSAKSGDGD
jgi:hypothetical protein